MAITIDWDAKIINVPKGEPTVATLVDPGPPEIYDIDVDAFRLILKDLEDGEEGMPFPDTHLHNTEVSLAGTTFARTIEIINGYTIEWADGQYRVQLKGGNTNFADVSVVNQVSIVPFNSGGLISSGGTTAQEVEDAVLNATIADHLTAGTLGAVINAIQNSVQAREGLVITGSTTTSIRTDLTQPDNFYNGMLVEVQNAAGTVTRRIDQYFQANGEIQVVEPLPFTPAEDDPIRVLTVFSGFDGRAA